MRSILDAEGPVETAKQGRDVALMEDCRIAQVVSQLSRYKVSVAALQETKWYGSGVYHVGEAIVLASGQPMPPPGEPLQRGEGVALVLSGLAVRAWREAGEQWNAWSQRIVSVRLQTSRKQSDILHVLSCHAPTRAANRAEKDTLFEDLQYCTVYQQWFRSKGGLKVHKRRSV